MQKGVQDWIESDQGDSAEISTTLASLGQAANAAAKSRAFSSYIINGKEPKFIAGAAQ